ncbi:MAG: hypothetical protein QXU45_00685 [Candidatus Bathyarchaeia archaeon]
MSTKINIPSMIELLVNVLIEVFVRSASQSVDVGFYREMSMHTYCGPQVVDWAYHDLSSKFKGRILPQEDYMVLEQVLLRFKGKDDELLIYDVSRVTDKLKALRKGVKRTPTVIINGKKYERLEEILGVLKAIANEAGR